MKPMSIMVALFGSAAILSVALLIGSYGVLSGISDGWIEHLYSNYYYLYGAISSVFVLLGGVFVSNVIMRGSMYGHFKSYLPVLLYSSVMALSVGNKFLYIAIAGLYVVWALFFVVSNNRNQESMAGFIFKMVMLVFLLTILHPAMIWLLLPFAGIVAYFRSSVGKELSVILLSALFFSMVYFWCSWFFGFDMSILIERMCPEYSFCVSVLSNSVALGMLLLVFLRWAVFKDVMATMDVLVCKLEQYSFLCIIVLSLAMLFIGSEWLIPLLAMPISIIMFVHRESLSSNVSKLMMLVVFFLVLVVVGDFILCNE